MECEDSVRYGRCAQIWGSVNYPKLRNGHRHSQLEISRKRWQTCRESRLAVGTMRMWALWACVPAALATLSLTTSVMAQQLRKLPFRHIATGSKQELAILFNAILLAAAM